MKIIKFVIRLIYRRLDGVAVAEGHGMPWWMGMMWSSVGEHEGKAEVHVYSTIIPLNLPVRWLRRFMLWVKFGVTPWAN